MLKDEDTVLRIHCNDDFKHHHSTSLLFLLLHTNHAFIAINFLSHIQKN